MSLTVASHREAVKEKQRKKKKQKKMHAMITITKATVAVGIGCHWQKYSDCNGVDTWILLNALATARKNHSCEMNQNCTEPWQKRF